MVREDWLLRVTAGSHDPNKQIVTKKERISYKPPALHIRDWQLSTTTHCLIK
jgi:hypothetical protein